MTQNLDAKTFLKSLRAQLPAMLERLKEFVCCESPSTEKPAADTCARLIATAWKRRGAQVEILEQKHRGAHLRITYIPESGSAREQLFVLGHYDTVYATGTLQNMPFRVGGGKVFGPGVFDMKAGIVQALFALDTLQQMSAPLSKRIVFLWTSDEEIGSESSRKLLEAEARRSDAVFVLEPALGPKGSLKTARKGVGEAQIIVHGRASHAGLAPEKGVNAIHELALQLARVKQWNNLPRGISVNAGIIEGGSRTNVIPDRAKAVIDLRALRIADMRTIETRLRALKPILSGAKLEICGGFSRAPLERKHSAELFQRATVFAKQMGLKIGECTAGGGSDGNFTAALGIPTLDGFGAVGDGAHSPDEFVVAKTMPERAALLAAMLLYS
ncbi:MAG TPA: M20 family metallopeptidase [Candidatus Acidoferrum sp.]|nr:M20 family metallopeptidase [Candidatus Acidoferrum sp.]